MKNFTKSFLAFFAAASILSSCKDNDDPIAEPQQPNENEIITTIKLIMTDNANPSNVSIATFKDPDGDGGQGPTIFDTIRLNPNKTYNVEVLLLDETKNPSDTISNEVEEEGDEHQLFYSVSGGASVTFAYTDFDVNGVPVGLSPTFTTGAITPDKNSKLKIVLKHQGEEKPNTGQGDPSLGSTDIEINFPILIK